MTGIFEDVSLRWGGHDYRVPPERVMGLIATVEDHVTLADLSRSTSPKLARLSMAYASALRYAGCSATADEVYAACFRDASGTIPQLINGLLALMIPPQELRDKMPESEKRTAATPKKTVRKT